ncbi:MAG: MlaD family protein [Verrucomicrobiota bacterium]
MKKHLTDFFIATFVIACSLLIVGSLAFALSGWTQGKKSGRVVEIDFIDVTGIHLHSEVRYAGAPAGSISAVRLLTPAERKNAQGDSPKRNAVRVTAILREDLPALPADVRASITSDTMLSDKFVAFSAGNPDGPTLPPHAILQGQSAAGLDALIESVGPMFKTAETMLQDLAPLFKKTTAAVDTFNHGMGEALPKVSKLVDGLKATSDSADLAIKRVDKLIGDLEQPVKADVLELRKTLVQIEQTMAAAQQLVSHTDRNLSGRMEELSVVLENLKVVSTYAKSLTQSLAEKPNRIIFSGKERDLPSEAEIIRSKKPVPARKSSNSL